jgi:hypothetical protein
MGTQALRKKLTLIGLLISTVACETLASKPPAEGPLPELTAEQQHARSGGKTLIILQTSCDRYSGTDATIQARVNASGGGYTNWVTLDNAGNDRERCDEDDYYVTFPAGSGSVLHLRTDSWGAGPSWKLAWASVYPPSGPSTKKIWNIWLGDRHHRGTWCVYEDTVPYNCP